MKQKKIPARMCVSCGEMKPKKELIRVVRAPDGVVSIDAGGRAQGRGAYICGDVRCVMGAKKRRTIERNLNVADCGSLFESLMELCEADGQQ